MKKQIFTVGYTIPTFDDNRVDFYEEPSLMDADILLVSPDSLIPRGDWVGFTTSDGGCYNVSASKKYKQKIAFLKKEIEDYLNSGKNVFIFLTKKEEYQLADSVSSERKGQNTFHTETYSNYNFLPSNIGTLTSASGKHIDFSGNPYFVEFYRIFKEHLVYKLYIENLKDAEIVFTGKDKTKILGAIYKVKKGHLIVLPCVDYDEVKFTKYSKKDNQSYWTEEAIKFGNNLAKTLVDIDKALSKGGDKTPPPNWINASKFKLSLELLLSKEIEKQSIKIDKLLVQKKELIDKMEEGIKLKDLLFEKGKTLETAITLALEILGYSAENYDDGSLELDHVILSPEGDRFIGEAEGKDNSAINIDKFRQLASNIQEDLLREDTEIAAGGILFGNGFRLTEPSKRSEQFTEKCINTAKSFNCALIRTPDLFRVSKYISESNDATFAKECRVAVKASFGKIVIFPEIKS